jgi:hypothetical protein
LLGYAIWNHLATPFVFVGEGIEIQELAPATKAASDGEFYGFAIRKNADALRYAATLLQRRRNAEAHGSFQAESPYPQPDLGAGIWHNYIFDLRDFRSAEFTKSNAA